VLIKDGKIAAVGKTVEAKGARILDLKGRHLYPGMIALGTVLGLTEIEAVRATQDSTEVGDYTPDVESWIAVNPDSELIPVARANGIACFEPVPEGGIVAGQSALLRADGWTTEEMVIKKPLGLHVYWPVMELDTRSGPAPAAGGRRPAERKSLEEQAKERQAKLRAIDEFFAEAGAYRRALEAAAQGKAAPPQKTPAWDALLPYVRGELPIIVHADEIRQIRAAVNWASSNGCKVILAGGRDAWMEADDIAAAKISVLFEHVFTLPARDTESYDVHFKAAETLRRAGVQIAFGMGHGGSGASLLRNLPYSAAQAVAFGFPAAEALKGLTLYPAQLAGVADHLGSIEPGKDATLFASDGDILDLRSNVKQMWIAGREISLESRHTRLYEKYRNRPRTK
jgi:imidazolonepropionase-like amidohydrolase